MSFLPVCVKLPAMAAQRKPTPRTQDHAALGRAIKLVIAENSQLSQSKVAERSGLDVRRVNALALGKGNPTYLTLLRLCDGLGVSLGALMTRAENLIEENAGHQSRNGQSG
jgi:DNA-binding Xre family transcriptional regulator